GRAGGDTVIPFPGAARHHADADPQCGRYSSAGQPAGPGNPGYHYQS
ncbi:hypothetical protein Tco_1022492, partial [Tanacetum coccineum]